MRKATQQSRAITPLSAVNKQRNASRDVTATNVLVLWIAGQAYGEEVALYYQSRRGIPAENMIPVGLPGWNGSAAISLADAVELTRPAHTVMLQRDIEVVVLCGDFPKTITHSYDVWVWVVDDCYRRPDVVMSDGWAAYPIDLSKGAHRARAYHTGFYDDYLAGWGKPEAYSPRIGAKNSGLVYYREAHPAWLRIPEWRPGTHYRVGTVIKHPVVGALGLVTCSVEGTSGDVRPAAPVLDPPDFYWPDGEVRWVPLDDITGYMPEFPRIGGFNRHPRDHRNRILAMPNTGSIQSPFYLVEDPAYTVMYSCARLVSGEFDPANPAYRTRLANTKRLIDDAIEVEQRGLRAVPGKQFVSGDVGTFNAQTGEKLYFGLSAYYELLSHADIVDMDTVYWDSIVPEATAAATYPVPDVATRYQVGDNRLQPVDGQTFTPATDLFFHFVGVGAYFSGGKWPWDTTQIGYEQGAITGFGRSCGAMGAWSNELDWWHGTYSLDVSADPRDATTAVNITADGGRTIFRLQYSGATGTVSVGTPGVVALSDDANGDTTLPAVPQSTNAAAIKAYLQANLPAGWSLTHGCSGSGESRASYAIKAGACVAFGSAIEPYTSNVWSPYGLVDAILSGCNIAEAMRFGGRQDQVHQDGVGTAIKGWWCVGDPLYRPFGFRRPE